METEISLIYKSSVYGFSNCLFIFFCFNTFPVYINCIKIPIKEMSRFDQLKVSPCTCAVLQPPRIQNCRRIFHSFWQLQKGSAILISPSWQRLAETNILGIPDIPECPVRGPQSLKYARSLTSQECVLWYSALNIIQTYETPDLLLLNSKLNSTFIAFSECHEL